MASGHPIYLDYHPINIYPEDNQVEEVVSQHPIPVPPALSPDHIYTGARYNQGPFTSAGVELNYRNRDYSLYNQAKPFYPLATTWLFIAPEPVIRYDIYNEGAQMPRSPGRQKSGQAPTGGVYTGYQYYPNQPPYPYASSAEQYLDEGFN